MSLRRWPHNPYNQNCIKVIQPEAGTKLGHIDQAATEWLSTSKGSVQNDRVS